MRILLYGEEIELMHQKALFWPKENVLVVADLHLGKVNHFRKSGIPVPTKVNLKNWELLVEIISARNPQRVVFLGDLFHSYYNYEWETLRELVKNYRHISFELVVGNHDVLSDFQYERNNIQLHDRLIIGPFLFTHHPLEEFADKSYNLAGHVHPGVRLSGQGKQAMTLPCFHFGEKQGLLPAFGMFTGFARVHPIKGDKVYVIANDEVLSV